MKTLLLSGWAQPDNALDMLAPDALHFDYSDYMPGSEVMQQLMQFKDVEYIIAWSLGGQLALNAIAEGALEPRHLTLVASQYQFVSDEHVKGMDSFTFEQFRSNYIANPTRTKTRFHALVAKGDSKASEIVKQLKHHPDVENTDRWLPWLDYLMTSPASGQSLENTPNTLIIHGTEDAIVPCAQAQLLADKIPKADINIWENVGHAPFLHDPERLRAEIAEHRAQVNA